MVQERRQASHSLFLSSSWFIICFGTRHAHIADKSLPYSSCTF